MVNKVILIGNVGRDAETRQAGNTKVASFTLATSETYKDRNGERRVETEWHNINAWGGLSEVCERFVKKGMMVYVEGRLKSEKYKDKDGVERVAVKIVADTLKMLSYPKDEGAATAQVEDDRDLPF